MSQNLLVKGHFDGTSVILDEPATLEIGQIVQVIIESVPALSSPKQKTVRPSRFGFAKGTFQMSDDFDEPLEEFAEYR